MTQTNETNQDVFVPTDADIQAQQDVMTDVITGRTVIQRQYNQFNNRGLYEAIDDWTTRWNGYISGYDLVDDMDESQMFLNFTRNSIISWLSKTAMQRPEVKITAVNKKTGVADKKFADFLKDLNRYSNKAENGDARYLESEMERVIKGTVVIYEGYAKNIQKVDVPVKFNAETGKIQTKKESRTMFEGCYQRTVPLEDFFIANPYQPDVQKQPFVIWRELTTKEEAAMDYGHYANFKYVKPGAYIFLGNPTTFYREQLVTNINLTTDQVEIIRYYNRSKNQHVVMLNGVILYNGAFPWKDGMYPFAKNVFEPFDNNFFWGAGLPNKIMGEQDLMNESWSTMTEKNRGSLRPYGLSSDLDDIIEDDVLRVNKIRKVSDINKWKFDTLPGVSAGEVGMLQQTVSFARENSGYVSGSNNPMNGGKITARQALLLAKEAQQMLVFSSSLAENLDRDRTKLRISHELQFCSIPKMEKITGLSGEEIQQLVYRDIRLDNTRLSDGKMGSKVMKLIDNSHVATPDMKQNLQDNLSVTEAMGEELGTPTEALAVSVDTFYDYNFEVEVVTNSSFQKNEILDQASRMEFANWRLSLAQIAPVDVSELVKWVEESYDIDTERFAMKPQMGQPGMPPGVPGQPMQGAEPSQGGMPQPAQQMAPGNMKPQSMPPLSNATQ